MKRISLSSISFAILFLFSPSQGFSEPATKEDIRILIKLIEETKDSLNKRIDDINRRIDDINNRIDDTNRRIDDTNKNIDTLRETMFWLFGTFISINIIILGFILRMQWQMHRRLQIVESTQESIRQSLETQRDEMNFLKGLVEKLVAGRQ